MQKLEHSDELSHPFILKSSKVNLIRKIMSAIFTTRTIKKSFDP